MEEAEPPNMDVRDVEIRDAGIRDVEIRDAGPDDAAAIARLRNDLLATTTCEWRTEPHTAAEIAIAHDLADPAHHPTLVATVDGVVIGWAGYDDFSDTRVRPGYRPSIEHSIHVDRAWWGHGVGRRLMEALMARARAEGRHVIVAAVDGENEESIRFHERLGFVEVGRLPEMGTKFGRYLDLVYLHRHL